MELLLLCWDCPICNYQRGSTPWQCWDAVFVLTSMGKVFEDAAVRKVLGLPRAGPTQLAGEMSTAGEKVFEQLSDQLQCV